MPLAIGIYFRKTARIYCFGASAATRFGRSAHFEIRWGAGDAERFA
jgi:hypothetical protein